MFLFQVFDVLINTVHAHIASRYIVVHGVDQKTDDNRAFFSNVGKTFTDVEENKSFRITSVVKKGQEKRLYYRYYDIYEHPSGPPKISPFYDDVEEDLFEYTHCAEITNPNSTYVRWLDTRTVDSHAALGTGGSVALPSSSSSSHSVSSARDDAAVSRSGGRRPSSISQSKRARR